VTAAALPRFILLYAALYAAFGVASPFLPPFLAERGMSPEAIGILLAAGTTIRLFAGPIAGRIADRLQALRLVLAICMAAAALAALGYLPAYTFWALLAVKLIHHAALAPTTTLADALALNAAEPREGYRGFEYGYVRGSGSAAFVLGLIASGQLVGVAGLSAILWVSAGLLAVAALLALQAPELPRLAPAARDPALDRGEVRARLRDPVFRRLVLVAALVLGSHAMHDGFAVIRWSEAGISAAVSSVLWSEQVAAEVLVFFVLGPILLRRVDPAVALALAAVLAAVRWIVMALTAEVWIMALTEPLHGITFALLHLACMRIIAQIVPQSLAGTAQAIYGAVGIGGAVALLTLVSGMLYGRFGAQGFWAMAALCVVALPLALSLRHRAQVSSSEPSPRIQRM
jgi:PPP family 3-phenylpropionic acid transporter